MSLFEELKRRNVIRVAVLYLVSSWVLLQLNVPEGVKRQKAVDRNQSSTADTGKRINALIIVLLVAAIAVVVLDRLLPAPAPVAISAVTARSGIAAPQRLYSPAIIIRRLP